MIINLFSVFDPSSSIINFSINWIRTISIIFILPNSFWFIPSKMIKFWKNTIYKINYEFSILLSYKLSYKITVIFISLFSIIIVNNLLGLFPYIFTRTSHMVISLTLSVPVWLSLIIFGWLKKTNYMFQHLVPQGTPSILIPFIVLIESIRNVIRPGTLAVRLSANIIAGHLIISLLGNQVANSENSILILLIFIQILLIILETAVAVIQAYVFATLSTLYCSEVSPINYDN